MRESNADTDRQSLAINIYSPGSVIVPDRRLSFVLEELTLSTY